MNSEDLAKNIKALLIEQHQNYFKTLNNATTNFKDPYWRSGQKVFESINEETKEDLKKFVQMCLIDTATELLAYIDDITRFDNQQESLSIYCGKEKIDSDIQDHLLMDVEDNGF